MKENEKEDRPRAWGTTDYDVSPPRGNPFPVVGVGASAGGLEAFVQLLQQLPGNTGMAFVLVQHLDPAHESLLPELLASHTEMAVVSVQDGMRIEPDHVYVIPPNTSMELQDGTLRLAKREPGLHLPIDIFFQSLAFAQGSRAIGIVLSGNASDGSVGVRAIKSECGITFAQTESSSRFEGMPRSAVATGAVDFVMEPGEIARELANIARHPFLVPSRPGDSHSETLPQGDGELRRIFAQLMGATRVDFARYKPTTVRRRIGRRMMVLRLETMGEYARYLDQNPGELRELYRDLLISVTSFFRDPESFKAFGDLLMKLLPSRADPNEAIRIWVAGCSTGEEIYTIAICLFELLQEMQKPIPLQLFGTDISDFALERSRRGMYPLSIEDDVTAERLQRFFTKVDHGYQISKTLRDCCIFARHDVTRDPPFSNLDAVSCRNLLIYLDQGTQRHVFPVFHYALKPTGILMLGSAESVAAASAQFIPADSQHKLYYRNAMSPRLPPDLGTSRFDAPLVEPPSLPDGMDLQRRLERLIQNRYSPDAVLIDSEYRIVQFRGHTSSYLDATQGAAKLNLLRMASENLVMPLRRTVQSAGETNGTVWESGIELENAGERRRITLEVSPLLGADGTERFFLVVFVRERATLVSQQDHESLQLLSGDERVEKLEQELNETRDYLRSLIEKYEVHSEELRAANEEARSSNEELQSTNEELRTTKEELQSANEELTTVNEELQSRNQELNSTNSDLRNLLNAVTIPILMVDSDLRVRRFNPAAAKMFELGPMDVGRPVGHIRGQVESLRLEQQVRGVMETLDACSEEVQDANGRWFSLMVRAYRTVDDRITGAVVTLLDIDPLKRGLKAAEEARDYAEGMIETVREPLVVLDSDLRVRRATKSFYNDFFVTREETEGRFIYDLGNGQWNNAQLREAIGNALFRGEPFTDFEIEHEFPHIGRRTMRLNGRRIPFPHLNLRMLLLSIEDITERRDLAEIRYRRLFETAKDGVVVIDLETETVQEVNPYMLQLTGYHRDSFLGRKAGEVGAMLGLRVEQSLEELRRTEMIRREDLDLTTRTGRPLAVDVVGNAYRVGGQLVVQFNVRDVTGRREAAAALRESEMRFRMFVESVADYALFQLDQEGRIVSWNVGAERLLGWTEQEAIGQPGELVFTSEDRERGEPAKELETARHEGKAIDERWHIRKDGTRFFATGVMSQVRDEVNRVVGYAKVMRDSTALREQDEQLRRSLSEKDTLVREIHHRVKNNLQVIVSLLSMQSRHTTDSEVLAAFAEAEGRLRAIAHLHERLYSSDDLTEVEFAGYVTGLVNELVQLHSSSPDQVKVELDVVDMVLHIERGVPLGLIANELVSNSLKHGLKNRGGHLLVRLEYVPEVTSSNGKIMEGGWARLEVADDGPGFPEGFDPSKTRSMGLRLVDMLIRQLRGRLEVGEGPGARLTVIFPLEGNR